MDYPPFVFGTWAVLAIGSWGWALRDAWRRSPVPFGLRSAVLVALAAGVAQAAAGWRLAGQGNIPPLLQAMAPAFGVAGFAFSPRVAAVCGLVCGTAFTVSDWAISEPVIAVASGAVVLGTALVAGGAIDLLGRAATKVERALEQRWEAQEAASRAAARAAGKVWWDGLVHDKVPGALRLASRARDDRDRRAAAELAREALATSTASRGGGVESRPALRSRVDQVCERLGLQLTWEVREEVAGMPADIALAVSGAVEEALTNVARHSGLRAVTVSGSVGGEVALDITDRGVGFDPRVSRPGRLGIERGILGRMARVGGSVEILASPGRGTTVRLRVPLGQRAGAQVGPSVPPERWRQRDFLPLLAIGSVTTVVFAGGALAMLDRAHSAAVVLALVVAVVGLGLAAAFGPGNRDSLAACLALGVGAVTLLGTWNLRDPHSGGWAFWFVGSLNATILLLVGRFHLRWGALAVVAALAGLAGGQLRGGGSVDVGVIVALLPQMIAFACAGWGVRRALDLATESVNSAAAEVGRLRLADASVEEAARVADARSQEVLVHAGHLLERIAAAEPLDDAERGRCRLAEAEARDGLVGAPLLTPGLRTYIRAARERGVAIAITADENDAEEGLPEFREIVGAIVRSAPPGSRVTARLRRDPRRRVGSVTMIGRLPDPPVLQEMLGRIREDSGDLDLLVSIDDDLLVELWSHH